MGAAPAVALLVTATPEAPLIAPEAVQPPVVCTPRVESDRCGWWQSAHSACRFDRPENSSSRSMVCAVVASAGCEYQVDVAGSLAGTFGSVYSALTLVRAPLPSWQVKQTLETGAGSVPRYARSAVWVAWQAAQVSLARLRSKCGLAYGGPGWPASGSRAKAIALRADAGDLGAKTNG